ncbi:hypothetical protein HK105_207716 [Polyrhizophydium stewartii]|uniref:Uncharacterized protein n=1 Tax=Polyrhizophydium stewartii TaxID=2732419 RepID=A0ABR4N020_9FUNG
MPAAARRIWRAARRTAALLALPVTALALLALLYVTEPLPPSSTEVPVLSDGEPAIDDVHAAGDIAWAKRTVIRISSTHANLRACLRVGPRAALEAEASLNAANLELAVRGDDWRTLGRVARAYRRGFDVVYDLAAYDAECQPRDAPEWSVTKNGGSELEPEFVDSETPEEVLYDREALRRRTEAALVRLESQLFPWFLQARSQRRHALQALGASHGRGIAMAVSTGQAGTARIAIEALRAAGCTLNITVVHGGERRLSSTARHELARLEGVQVLDAREVMGIPVRPSHDEMRFLAGLAAPYREVILMDPDVVFFADAGEMLGMDEYMRAGTLLFKDRSTPFGGRMPDGSLAGEAEVVDREREDEARGASGPGTVFLLTQLAEPFLAAGGGELRLADSRLVMGLSGDEMDGGVAVVDKTHTPSAEKSLEASSMKGSAHPTTTRSRTPHTASRSTTRSHSRMHSASSSSAHAEPSIEPAIKVVFEMAGDSPPVIRADHGSQHGQMHQASEQSWSSSSSWSSPAWSPAAPSATAATQSTWTATDATQSTTSQDASHPTDQSGPWPAVVIAPQHDQSHDSSGVDMAGEAGSDQITRTEPTMTSTTSMATQTDIPNGTLNLSASDPQSPTSKLGMGGMIGIGAAGIGLVLIALFGGVYIYNTRLRSQSFRPTFVQARAQILRDSSDSNDPAGRRMSLLSAMAPVGAAAIVAKPLPVMHPAARGGATEAAKSAMAPGQFMYPPPPQNIQAYNLQQYEPSFHSHPMSTQIPMHPPMPMPMHMPMPPPPSLDYQVQAAYEKHAMGQQRAHPAQTLQRIKSPMPSQQQPQQQQQPSQLQQQQAYYASPFVPPSPAVVGSHFNTQPQQPQTSPIHTASTDASPSLPRRHPQVKSHRRTVTPLRIVIPTPPGSSGTQSNHSTLVRIPVNGNVTTMAVPVRVAVPPGTLQRSGTPMGWQQKPAQPQAPKYSQPPHMPTSALTVASMPSVDDKAAARGGRDGDDDEPTSAIAEVAGEAGSRRVQPPNMSMSMSVTELDDIMMIMQSVSKVLDTSTLERPLAAPRDADEHMRELERHYPLNVASAQPMPLRGHGAGQMQFDAVVDDDDSELSYDPADGVLARANARSFAYSSVYSCVDVSYSMASYPGTIGRSSAAGSGLPAFATSTAPRLHGGTVRSTLAASSTLARGRYDAGTLRDANKSRYDDMAGDEDTFSDAEASAIRHHILRQ